MNNFDLSKLEHEVNVARVKKQLFKDKDEVEEPKRRKMEKPIKRVETLENKIQEYQKKNPQLPPLYAEFSPRGCLVQ